MRYIGKGRRLARGALVAAAVTIGGFAQPADWASRYRVPGSWVPGAWAKDGQAYLEKAQAYIAKGNFNAAEIELRNAEREAPNDPSCPRFAGAGLFEARQFRVRGARRPRRPRPERPRGGVHPDTRRGDAAAGKTRRYPRPDQAREPRAGTRKQDQGGAGGGGERAARSRQSRIAAPRSGRARSQRRGRESYAGETAA